MKLPFLPYHLYLFKWGQIILITKETQLSPALRASRLIWGFPAGHFGPPGDA